MQANVRLDAGTPLPVLMVPKESVVDNEGQSIVYVLLSGEEFERRNVVTGDEYGSKVAILSGIKPGERVVSQGAYQLKLQELKPADAGAHTHEV
jgi:membrane fusion protein, heavy metal efflux system